MEQFIIITKPIKFGWGVMPYLKKEIQNLLMKKINVEIKHNKSDFILVREIDDSIFLDTDFNAVSYVSQNRIAINTVNKKYTESIFFDCNEFDTIEKIKNIELKYDFI
jgi:mannose/fructose/N-acetylgalactosamine-specific phosphotransferase system component IIB